MYRPSEATRQNLIQAAISVFAEKGFAGGSVRTITQKAKANQAAITYHFGGKEGLYREVLRATLGAFREFSLLDADMLDGMDRDVALRLFVRQQLLPLLRRNKLGPYLRILNWEMLQRTDVFQDFVATEGAPFLAVAEGIVRKFLADTATAEEILITAIWLLHQGVIFVRSHEHFGRPPFSLEIDEAFVERLIDILSRLLHSALSGSSAATPRA